MRAYFALAFPKPSGGFVMEFPDLPDCVAFGDSDDAVRDAAAGALADHIEDMERAGQAIPEPSPYEAIQRDPRNIGCDIIRVEAVRAIK